jgi:hypothetical protein
MAALWQALPEPIRAESGLEKHILTRDASPPGFLGLQQLLGSFKNNIGLPGLSEQGFRRQAEAGQQATLEDLKQGPLREALQNLTGGGDGEGHNLTKATIQKAQDARTGFTFQSEAEPAVLPSTEQPAQAPFSVLSLMKDDKGMLSQLGLQLDDTATKTVPLEALRDLHTLGWNLPASTQGPMVTASWRSSSIAPLPWEAGAIPPLPIPIQNATWLSSSQGGIQGLQLQTNIAQLGDVTVRIDMLDGMRRIQLSADNLASAHALSLSAPRLEQQLAQAGLQDVRVHVNINSHNPFASLGHQGSNGQRQDLPWMAASENSAVPTLPGSGSLEQALGQAVLDGPHAINLLA